MAKSFIAEKTMDLRYSAVLTLAKYLTPSLYYQVVKSTGRGMLAFMLEKYGHIPLVGAEVGVYTATHAYHILSVLSIKQLYLIDPYMPYVDGNGVTWNVSDKEFHIAQTSLRKFKQCQFIRKVSLNALTDLPDELDFVYIDANHNYEYVKADVEAYYPKVRKGGVIGGHDFAVQYQGVIHAVVDFARKIDAKLHVDSSDWWIVK